MMVNGNMDVAIRKAMVVWAGALSTRPTIVAGDIAQKVVQVCCKSIRGLLNALSIIHISVIVYTFSMFS